MYFDPDSKEFHLVYEARKTSLPTEIFLNQAWHYPNGFTIWLTPSGLSWNQIDQNHLAVYQSAIIPEGQQIVIKIVPT